MVGQKILDWDQAKERKIFIIIIILLMQRTHDFSVATGPLEMHVDPILGINSWNYKVGISWDLAVGWNIEPRLL